MDIKNSRIRKEIKSCTVLPFINNPMSRSEQKTHTTKRVFHLAEVSTVLSEMSKKSASPKHYIPAYKKNPALKAIYKDSDVLDKKIKNIKSKDYNTLEDYHNRIVEELYGTVSNDNLSKLVGKLKNVRVVNRMDMKAARKVEKIEEEKELVFPGLPKNVLFVKVRTGKIGI
jgi:hypothetical protein